MKRATLTISLSVISFYVINLIKRNDVSKYYSIDVHSLQNAAVAAAAIVLVLLLNRGQMSLKICQPAIQCKIPADGYSSAPFHIRHDLSPICELLCFTLHLHQKTDDEETTYYDNSQTLRCDCNIRLKISLYIKNDIVTSTRT